MVRIVFAIFLCSTLLGVYDGHLDWASSAGFAATAISKCGDPFWGNPSGLTMNGKYSFWAIAEREWGLSELSTGRISGSMRLSPMTVAVGGSFTGDASLYTETVLGLSGAKDIGIFGVGSRINLIMVKSDDWNAVAPVLALGAHAKIDRTLSLGLFADNVTYSKIDGNEIPFRGGFGALIEPVEWIDFGVDFYADGDNPLSIRLGQEFAISSIVFIRSGVVFRPNTFHIGLGTKYKGFGILWSYIGHPELGGSTMVGISYEGED